MMNGIARKIHSIVASITNGTIHRANLADMMIGLNTTMRRTTMMKNSIGAMRNGEMTMETFLKESKAKIILISTNLKTMEMKRMRIFLSQQMKTGQWWSEPGSQTGIRKPATKRLRPS